MASIVRQLMRFDQQPLDLFCGGMSFVGINVLGTWTGTIKFFAGNINVNYGPNAIGVYPYPDGGTVVSSITANGQYFWPVQNYQLFRVQLSLTSGNPLVVLSTSIDGSWQDAFLATALNPGKYFNKSVAGALNTQVFAAQSAMAYRLRSLSVSVMAAPSGQSSSSSNQGTSAVWRSSPVVTVLDGTNQIFGLDLPTTTPAQYTIPLPPVVGVGNAEQGGLEGTPGKSMTIQIANAGPGILTNQNVEIGAA